MNILVTGGSGFIGSNFILYWLKNYPSDKIINLDKLTYAGNPENLKTVEDSRNYKFILGDICDPKKVDSLMQGVDMIVHFAAESHVDRSILSPSSFVRTNIVGTHILLDSALRHRIKRFHHISTDEVFGSLELSEKKGFRENSAYNPSSPYAASKAAADHLVRAYFRTYSLPVTISNCSNNFGPFQFPEKLIPLAITNLLEGKKVPVYGDGLYVRDWLYVGDHCAAIDLILRKGKIGETYCIGGLKKDINNLEVIKKILSILGKTRASIEFVKDRPGHDRKYALDWSRIEREFGWKPTSTFDDKLIETVGWYKDSEDWWKKVKSGQYLDYYKKQYTNR